ncbi:NAD-dependent epimerase/dehydratase family protein [Brevibacterium senegalense]|uniref:NAD-dependent epimerase/dehydratase family protein n=1 Tax=Brevibacterium senegalense TaxID=1033736 RepID=UPI000A04A323|nr:NAD(P)-dependent oxidoreductase [Brevibacterium senegalense]
MKILITGAGGLLGSSCVRLLLSDTNHDLLAVSSQPQAALREKWDLEDHEFNRVATVRPELFFSNPLGHGPIDIGINCAWPLNRGGGELARGLDFHVSLFKSLHAVQAKVLVNVSSQSVYDSSRKYLAAETSDLDLDGPYAAAKYAAELLSRELCPDASVTQARVSSLIHPQFHRRLVNKMTAGAVRTGSVTLVQPKHVFDFMDARDASRAIATIALKAEQTFAPIVNVGAQNPLTLEAIGNLVAEHVRELANRSVDVIETHSAPTETHFSSGLDSSLLHNAWNFRPRYSIVDTIQAAALRAMNTK